MLAFVVRSTPRWLLGIAGCLMLVSFAAGFAISRYGIDRELAKSAAVLDRSMHAYEAEQTFLFGQWADNYTQLRERIAALPERKEIRHHGRR